MAKPSKFLQWTMIIAVTGGVAVYFLTEPEGGKKSNTRRTTTTRSAAPEGFKEEDLTARFPRIAAPVRDVFQPKVLSKKTQPLSVTPQAGLEKVVKPTWTLTGIYLQNGVRMALLENAASGESQSVTVGQSWMGQPIIAIRTDGVLFANGTRMVFPEPEEASAAPMGVAPVVLPNIPPGSAIPRAGVARETEAGTRPLTLNPPPGVAPTQPTGSRP